jgi:hypothetical protein
VELNISAIYDMFDVCTTTPAKVVDYTDGVATGKEVVDSVTADETCASRDDGDRLSHLT